MALGQALVPALSLTSRGTLGRQYCLHVTVSCKKIRVNHRALRSLRLPWCRAKSASSPQSGLDRWGGFLRLPHPCTEQARVPRTEPEPRVRPVCPAGQPHHKLPALRSEARTPKQLRSDARGRCSGNVQAWPSRVAPAWDSGRRLRG